jgi:hypothetical protein
VKLTSLLAFAGIAAAAAAFSIARAQDQGAHAPSGGTHVTVVSIAVPPIPDAPFTATVTTTWVRTLDDGATQTIGNHRIIARDNAGRVFQERHGLYPEGDPRVNDIRQLEFADPSTNIVYYCKPMERVCETHNYFPRMSPAVVVPAGPVDNGAAFLARIDLGSDTVSGVEVTGTRETTTFAPGVTGSDKAMSVVKEFWYSKQLGINVIEKREDPRVGTQTFTVSQIALGEPDARLFEMPAGYRIVDLRSDKPGENSGSN